VGRCAELLAHDAEAWVARVRAPILCICGEKDIQCDPQDGHRIAAIAKGRVDVHVIPDLTAHPATRRSPTFVLAVPGNPRQAPGPKGGRHRARLGPERVMELIRRQSLPSDCPRML
jgi:hypothetical protein